MNARQMAKYAMHNTVLSLILEFFETWKNNIAFTEAIQEFQEKHDFITKVVKDKGRKMAGVGTGKRNKKSLLGQTSLRMAGILRAFASKTNNAELLAEMSFSRSELLYMSDNKLGPVAKSIYDELQNYKVELAKYGATDERIEAFNQLISEYKTSSTSVHKARMVRKSLGVRLSTLLAELDSFLDNQLDQLMLEFEPTDPAFYQSYENCRELVDPKTSSTQFSGKVTNAETGKALRYALVEAEGTIYLTNVASDGHYKLLVPKPGVYTLSFELAGYETVQVTGELKLGKTTEMNVEMKKVG